MSGIGVYYKNGNTTTAFTSYTGERCIRNDLIGYIELGAAILEQAEEDLINAIFSRNYIKTKEILDFIHSDYGELISGDKGEIMIERIYKALPEIIIPLETASEFFFNCYGIKRYFVRHIIKRSTVIKEIKTAANNIDIDLIPFTTETGYKTFAISGKDWLRILAYFDFRFDGLKKKDIAELLK